MRLQDKCKFFFFTLPLADVFIYYAYFSFVNCYCLMINNYVILYYDYSYITSFIYLFGWGALYRFLVCSFPALPR